MVSLGGTRIVVATRAVDFRKGHDGLAAVVHNELGLNPYSGVAYVFRAKRADRIKVRVGPRGLDRDRDLISGIF